MFRPSYTVAGPKMVPHNLPLHARWSIEWCRVSWWSRGDREFRAVRTWALVTVYCEAPPVRPDIPTNPYRELHRGFTTLGWGARNYAFSDNSLVGWVLKAVTA